MCSETTDHYDTLPGSRSTGGPQSTPRSTPHSQPHPTSPSVPLTVAPPVPRAHNRDPDSTYDTLPPSTPSSMYDMLPSSSASSTTTPTTTNSEVYDVLPTNYDTVPSRSRLPLATPSSSTLTHSKSTTTRGHHPQHPGSSTASSTLNYSQSMCTPMDGQRRPALPSKPAPPRSEANRITLADDVPPSYHSASGGGAAANMPHYDTLPSSTSSSTYQPSPTSTTATTLLSTLYDLPPSTGLPPPLMQPLRPTPSPFVPAPPSSATPPVPHGYCIPPPSAGTTKPVPCKPPRLVKPTPPTTPATPSSPPTPATPIPRLQQRLQQQAAPDSPHISLERLAPDLPSANKSQFHSSDSTLIASSTSSVHHALDQSGPTRYAPQPPSFQAPPPIPARLVDLQPRTPSPSSNQITPKHQSSSTSSGQTPTLPSSIGSSHRFSNEMTSLAESRVYSASSPPHSSSHSPSPPPQSQQFKDGELQHSTPIILERSTSVSMRQTHTSSNKVRVMQQLKGHSK